MPFRISSSSAAIAAQRYLSKSQREVDVSLKRLASGSRTVNAGDDAAGFAISEGLRGQIRGLKQASQNAESALAFVQTAEGGLNEQNNILIRLRELSVQSASDTIGDQEREYIDKEFQQLVQEFDRIALSTRFGHKQLLTGSGEQFEFHIGASKDQENVIKFALDANTTASEVGISGLAITDQDSARDIMSDIDTALSDIADARSTFGAVQSRFQYAIDNLSVQTQNLEEARSTLSDVDVAQEVTNLTKNQILQDIGVSVLAQANASSKRALALINN
ncbi:MAG: flagellin FliC [Bdellovibrionaceae bacterium]|nr:flagellin FliC [Pseudobdellovibrionaceae bacterium]